MPVCLRISFSVFVRSSPTLPPSFTMPLLPHYSVPALACAFHTRLPLPGASRTRVLVMDRDPPGLVLPSPGMTRTSLPQSAVLVPPVSSAPSAFPPLSLSSFLFTHFSSALALPAALPLLVAASTIALDTHANTHSNHTLPDRFCRLAWHSIFLALPDGHLLPSRVGHGYRNGTTTRPLAHCSTGSLGLGASSLSLRVVVYIYNHHQALQAVQQSSMLFDLARTQSRHSVAPCDATHLLMSEHASATFPVEHQRVSSPSAHYSRPQLSVSSRSCPRAP